MNTHETYVSREVAKLLKEAGFDWECIMAYDAKLNNHIGDYGIYNHNKVPDFTSAPTLAVAQRWLREVKNTHIEIYPQYYSHFDDNSVWTKDTFAYYLGWCNDFDEDIDISGYQKTYEDVLDETIKKCLELILEKGE